MRRLALAVAGLVLMAAATAVPGTPAAADDPVSPDPISTTLVNERVELLPQRPLCWNLFRLTTPAGARVPAQGYAAAPLSVVYLSQGEIRGEYSAGPTWSERAGQAHFIGENNWFAHQTVSSGPATHLVFTLSCPQYPPAGTPGVTQLANTGELTGIRPGVPYSLFMAEEVRLPTTELRPLRLIPGPAINYVLEGSVYRVTGAGSRRYGPGELYVNPPGEPFVVLNAGPGPSRLVTMRLWPVGEAGNPQPNLPFANPFLRPTALPSAGDALDPVALAVAGLGVALLAMAAFGRRRTLQTTQVPKEE